MEPTLRGLLPSELSPVLAGKPMVTVLFFVLVNEPDADVLKDTT